jgi:hypothetical protein
VHAVKLDSRHFAGSLACFLALAAPAAAGTPGPTQSLGKSKGLEYFKAKYASVVTQTAQPVTCASGDVTGGGGALAGSSEPWDSKDKGKVPDDGWQARALNNESRKVGLVALAVCRKP